jgi:hypothetical protein
VHLIKMNDGTKECESCILATAQLEQKYYVAPPPYPCNLSNAHLTFKEEFLLSTYGNVLA